jgi:hypothetical protein
MIVRLLALLAFVALVAGSALAEPTPAPAPVAEPTPAATFMPIPPPPSNPPTALPAAAPTAVPKGVSTPQPPPPANLLTYTGQILDVRNDYVYFTTGDAFATVDPLRIVSYDTGAITTIPPATKMYAKATFDVATHKIIELAITNRRLPVGQTTDALIGFAISKTAKSAAAELAGGQKITGKQVAVTFEINAPPTTNLTDELYISTDVSSWSPTEIKLDRIDAYRYRAQRYYASGTKFSYRVTRGSWNSVERGEDGLDSPPHQFFVREVDAMAARVTVYHWSDENAAHPQAGPNAIPTPYNSNPFGGGPGGITVPQLPTPQATHFPR